MTSHAALTLRAVRSVLPPQAPSQNQGQPIGEEKACSIASIMAEDPENADIAAHVANIRRKLGRRNGAMGKRKKPPESD